MQNNPEIEQIIDHAVRIARDKHHYYVVTEHLLAAMLETNRVLATIDIGGNALSDAAMARLREVWGARDAKTLRFDF